MSLLVSQILKNTRNFSEFVDDEKNADLALLAVTEYADDLKLISQEYQTYAVCKKALKQNSLILEFIKAPNQKLYKIAILNSNIAKMGLIVNMVQTLEMDLDIFNHIIITTRDLETKTWLCKFPRESFSEPVIMSFFKMPYNFAFMKFLQEQNIPLTGRIRKRIFSITMTSGQQDWFETTENDVKKYAKKRFSLPPKLEQKWASCLEMTFTDFNKFYNKTLALKLCKNPTKEMITIAAMIAPWTTINILLEKNMLDADLLLGLLSVISRSTLKRPDSSVVLPGKMVPKINDLEEVINEDNLKKLDMLHVSKADMTFIRSKNVIIYEYLRNNNKHHRTYNNVITINHDDINRDSTTIYWNVKDNWNVDVELDILETIYGIVISSSLRDNNIFVFYRKDADKHVKVRTTIILG